MLLVAGPYRSGTGDDPSLIDANMQAMTAASLRLFRAGHLPVTGEALGLPLVAEAGSSQIGDDAWDEIMHPLGRLLAARCDATVRIGGPSRGADEMVEIARAHGRLVFHGLDEVPVLR
jgi:hypothetical protein